MLLLNYDSRPRSDSTTGAGRTCALRRLATTPLSRAEIDAAPFVAQLADAKIRPPLQNAGGCFGRQLILDVAEKEKIRRLDAHDRWSRFWMVCRIVQCEFMPRAAQYVSKSRSGIAISNAFSYAIYGSRYRR